VCLVKPSATAIILSSVFIGLNNFFSGLIVLPQLMVGNFYSLPYYLAPGHYVYEGLVVSLYAGNDRIVLATPGETDGFAQWLQDQGLCLDVDTTCNGTCSSYIDYFFDGNFSVRHVDRNIFILGGILVLTRVLTYVCLKYVKFSG
jgi:hypothetical protein